MMPVRLSVTEVHWRIIATLGFPLYRALAAVLLAGAVLLAAAVLRANHLAPC